MKPTRIRKSLALLLALVMVLSLLPMTALAEGEGGTTTVQVSLSAQRDNEFLLTEQPVTVASNLAEDYGYTDSVSGVSALDVLVRTHELAYGSLFTADTASTYLTLSGTSITKSFEIESTAVGFAVNGISPNDGIFDPVYNAYTGYAITEAAVSAGDLVEFYFYQDELWLDNYTWFVQDGAATRSITAQVDTAINLALKGYTIGWYGCNYTSFDEASTGSHATAIESAQLALVDQTTGVITDISDAVTDEDGTVQLTFPTSGTYMLTAYMPAEAVEDGDFPIIMPLATLTVNDAPAAATVVSAATADAMDIVLTMSAALTGTTADASAFTVSGVASNPSVTEVAVSGTKVTLSLDKEIVGTDSPAVSYTKPAAGYLTSGTPVDSFTDVAVSIGNLSVPYKGQLTTGTYTISNANQLEQLAAAVNNGTSYEDSTFTLTQDINLSTVCGATLGAGGAPVSWEPIGNLATTPFSGILDGNGFTISELYINATVNDYGGLFKFIENATIKTLTVSGQLQGRNRAGGFAHTAKNSLIEDCVNEISITLTNNNAAGFIYMASDVKLIRCVNKADISGQGSISGLVATFSSGTAETNIIDFSENKGTIFAKSAAAGIVSTGGSATIQNSVNRGSVTSDPTGNGGNSAGIAGSSQGLVKHCTNYGAITGKDRAAGIVGALENGTIENCENHGIIIATNSTNATAHYSGGIVGNFFKNSKMSGCYNYNEVKGSVNVGGIIGYAFATSAAEKIIISESYNRSPVVGISNGVAGEGKIGGLLGQVRSAGSVDISTCYNTGTVRGENLPSSGGLIGYAMLEAAGKTQIQNCYNAASVSGKEDAGGLIGLITSGTITTPQITLKNCYTAGDAVTSAKVNSAGTAIGKIEKLTDSQHFIFSNVFARSHGALKIIEVDSASLDAFAIMPRTAVQLADESFLSLIGGAYAKFSPAIFGVGEDADEIDEHYKELYENYEYPILLELCEAEPNTTHNVQVLGALYTTVIANNIKTYATTVSDGGSVNFTVTSDYPDAPYNIAVAQVQASSGTLTENDGVYTLSGVSVDTVVTVSITYDELPTEEIDTARDITFNVADATATPLDGVSITVKNSDDDVQTATEGVYKLEDGAYTVVVSKPGYHEVSGSFEVSKNGSVNVTLYQGESHTLTLETENSGFHTHIYNGDIRIASTTGTTADGYSTHTHTLPAGDYTYRTENAKGGTGGGPLKIDGNKTTILRFVDFSSSLQNKDNASYTVSVTSADGAQVYTPGSSDSLDGGVARGYFVLPASAFGEEYRYTFKPVNTQYWGSSGITYLYNRYTGSSGIRNFSGLNLSDGGVFVIARKTDVSITVPSNAGLHLYHRVKFYEPLEELAAKTTVDNQNGTTTYTYDTPNGYQLHYELRLQGYVKKAAVIDTAKTKTLSITAADLVPAANAASDISNKYDANLLTNAPNSNFIELQTGEEFELYLFRSWQAVNSETGNYYVDPDYQLEVISGDSVALTNPYYAGATIQAVKSGVSVIRVTYDALQYVDTLNNTYLYSKLYEANTVLIVVNVNPAGGASINTGIMTQDSDTQYFIRSVNGISRSTADQYAEYTFTPTVTGSTVKSVSIHAPVGSKSDWVDTWQTINKNSDGSSYTAKLAEGRSIIRITAADGTEAYYTIKALGLDATIEGGATVTLNGRDFEISSDVADTLKVSFQGLKLPVPKLAAVSNPGYDFYSTGTTYAVYTMAGANTDTQLEVKSKTSQYDISTVNEIALNFESPDTYTLSGGRLHTTIIGSTCGPYINISKGGATGPQATYSNGANTLESRNNLYGTLPNITLKVNGIPDTGTAHTITITAPTDLTRLTVRNQETGYKAALVSQAGGVYTYSLYDNDDTANYSYYAERSGYVTQIGSFMVSTSDSTSEAINKATITSGWEPIVRSGSATVDIVGYETVLSAQDTVTISNTPTDLVSKGYVQYNHGGYTVLHALVDALLSNKASFTCTAGSLAPAITISGTVGTNADWICEVNGEVVADYANTLVSGNDKVVFYYNPDTAANMRHAWFVETELTAKRDGAATFTLMSTPVSNDGTSATPVSGATVYIDGKEWGKTDGSGKITLSNLSALALGPHAVTAQLNKALTFSRAILNIERVSDAGTETPEGKVTVTFRMIGDTVHPAAYKGYINWIKTETHVMDEGTTMEDLFVKVLAAHGMAHNSTSGNYISWICAPSILGGYKLEEFSNGRNSGWMYTVNGQHPFLGLREYVLEDNDEIIWHYVNDYTLESTYEGSVPKYLNSWLIAADVKPYKGMVDESQDNAENSAIGSPKTENADAVVIAPKVTAKDGVANASIGASEMSKAIEDAKKNESSAIIIEPEVSGKAIKTSVEIPKASLSTMTSDTNADLQMNTRTGNITIPHDTLASIVSQASGSTVSISIESVETKSLTAEQQKLVGNSAVFDISILSNGQEISSFGGKSLTISLPYTLKTGETAEGVTVWYLSDSGKLEKMTCKYDKATGLATFTTNHLSNYVVGYETVWKNPFTDVKSGDWFFDAVKYAVQNELFTGTSATTFSPNTDMTRAMLVTVLYRLEGKPTVTGANAFSDVKAGEWYTDAVLWASENKIVEGYGNGLFGVNDYITREQMATILYRYAQMRGYSTTKTEDLAKYTDAAKVNTWADAAMKWTVAEGLITGRTTTTLAPDGTASRAEVATILMRFMENVVK